MKKAAAILLVLLLTLSALALPAFAEEPTFTIMVYLCGTDLESEGSAASVNLYEMVLAEAQPENVNVVVQTGGTAQWALDEIIATDRIQRFILENQDLTLVDEQPLASMGHPQTLYDFITFSEKNYPADRYMLLFWNHGGGSVMGVCNDELFGGDSLVLSEIDNALENAGVHFDIVGFDTCLMATLENAAMLAPYADYMVASEEYEPGGGWDYTSWVKYVFQNPGASSQAIGQAICDSYYAKCAASGLEDMATLSVIDLSKVQPLLVAFEAMAREMNGAAKDVASFRELTSAVRRAENYGGNNDKEGYTNMVDLGDLVTKAESVLSDTAMGVLDALFEAVTYNVRGTSRINANGLAVFYPLKVEYAAELEIYQLVAPSGMYLRYVQTVAGYSPTESTQGWVPSYEPADWESYTDETLDFQEDEEWLNPEDYALEFVTYIDEDADYMLEVTEGLEAVESVQFVLSYLDYEYSEYMELGADNDLNGDWDEGYFYDNFRGVWPTLNGEYCALLLLEETDDYNLYTIPVLLNGEKASIRAMYLFGDEAGYYQILGAWDGLDSETGMSGRNVRRLQDGDEIALLFDAYSWETGEYTTYTMGGFTVDGEVCMEETPLFDGEYEYYYVVYDTFGNSYYSQSVILTIEGEDIYIEEDY